MSKRLAIAPDATTALRPLTSAEELRVGGGNRAPQLRRVKSRSADAAREPRHNGFRAGHQTAGWQAGRWVGWQVGRQVGHQGSAQRNAPNRSPGRSCCGWRYRIARRTPIPIAAMLAISSPRRRGEFCTRRERIGTFRTVHPLNRWCSGPNRESLTSPGQHVHPDDREDVMKLRAALACGLLGQTAPKGKQ